MKSNFQYLILSDIESIKNCSCLYVIISEEEGVALADVVEEFLLAFGRRVLWFCTGL